MPRFLFLLYLFPLGKCVGHVPIFRFQTMSYLPSALLFFRQLAPTSQQIMYDQCNEFEPFFELFAYYGILRPEDSHCFRLEATILRGAYLLATGSLLLALSNTFVMRASSQYFWDREEARKALAMEHHLTPEEVAVPLDEKALADIHPPPVLFTDTFRWILRREHLGDRPLQGIVVEEQDAAHADQEKLSSASTGSQEPS